MATLRNKRKLAAVTRETQEEHPRNGQSRNTSVPRINEEYITQVSEEIEGRVSKKLSQEFSRTESRILGALSKLHEFLLNQQVRTHSETVPGTFRNTNVENQGSEWGRLPECSSSWSRHLPRPYYTKLWPKRLSWHGDMSYRRNSSLSSHGGRSYGRNSSLSWHGDRSSGRDPLSPRHGDRRFISVAQWPWHSDSSSRRDSLLLLWNFLRKTKEGALH